MPFYKPPEYASNQTRQECPRCRRKGLYFGVGRWRCQACGSIFTQRGRFVGQRLEPAAESRAVEAAEAQEVRDDVPHADAWWKSLSEAQRVWRYREAVRLRAWERAGEG